MFLQNCFTKFYKILQNWLSEDFQFRVSGSRHSRKHTALMAMTMARSLQMPICKPHPLYLGPFWMTAVTAASRCIAPPTLLAASSSCLMWTRACLRVFPRRHRTLAAERKLSSDTWNSQENHSLAQPSENSVRGNALEPNYQTQLSCNCHFGISIQESPYDSKCRTSIQIAILSRKCDKDRCNIIRIIHLDLFVKQKHWHK